MLAHVLNEEEELPGVNFVVGSNDCRQGAVVMGLAELCGPLLAGFGFFGVFGEGFRDLKRQSTHVIVIVEC